MGGKLVKSEASQRIPVIDPATEEVNGSTRLGTPGNAERYPYHEYVKESEN